MTKDYLFKLLLVVGLVSIVSIASVSAQTTDPMPKDTPPQSDSTGVYIRKSEKSIDNLTLSADKKAVWVAKVEGKDDIVFDGTWEEKDGNLTVTIPAKEGGKEVSVTFKVSKEEIEVTASTPEGILPVGTKFLKEKS